MESVGRPTYLLEHRDPEPGELPYGKEDLVAVTADGVRI